VTRAEAGEGYPYAVGVTATLIGYAHCSTDEQGLTAQRDILLEFGAAADRIYLDKGLTGTNRRRPGLDQSLAAVRAGDHTIADLAELFSVSRPTVYRVLERARPATAGW
jgi:hypothetical protein